MSLAFPDLDGFCRSLTGAVSHCQCSGAYVTARRRSAKFPAAEESGENFFERNWPSIAL
jgi:hypothetical protein